MSNNLSPINSNLANQTKYLLRKYKLRAKKHLGQNFLISSSVLEEIVEAADLKKGDVVLEIGPGLGTLTRALANQAREVIALEKDPRLVEILIAELSDFSNISILNEDARSFLFNQERFNKVVANLPFYLTSLLINQLISLSPPPELIVLMVQKEVAERICARPPKNNRLAVLCQLQAECQLVSRVPAKSFYPAPEVDAAILKIKAFGPSPDPFLVKLVNAGFSSPRKTLANNFVAHFNLSRSQLEQCGFNSKIRAEALTLEDWQRIKNCFLDNQIML